MKWLWLCFGLLMVGAVIVLWQETTPTRALSPTPATSARTLEPVRPSAQPPAVRQASVAAAVPAAATSANVTETTGAVRPASGAAAETPSRPLPTIEHATVVPSRLEVQPDGSIIADNRFRIMGKGTAADPYRVSWEALASAQETYIPRLSEDQIPERIAMLDGKVVSIEGYVTFPLLQREASELIVMLNQWDGCCIGLPPTPYDAIEVKLAQPVTNTRRHAGFTFGSVTGTFKVEPFLVENWLVGLYVMEDAVYEPEGL
ncbi:MAG: hypothetical protein KF724_05525 [Phycisphaeraceae bacterium]|nr:hypothetical protein [Phycisphaeraceae bacterium]